MSAAILITLLLLVVVIPAIVVVVRFIRTYRRKADDAGFATLGEYLRATPTTDEEKQDAVDLALKGLVVCVLGLVFPPLLLVGVFPLFFGARKIAYASIGLGLIDDEI